METGPIVHIVDDDTAARESVAAMVASKGVQVRDYVSAEEFLERADRSGFGCLLTDVRMPGLNGLELQDAIRQEGCDMPVIVITGYGDVPTAVNAFRGGAVTFLEKPCDAQELWQHISKALEGFQKRRFEETQRREIVRRYEGLSESESGVLNAMVDGKPNKVIASELFLGLRTVELRRANVLKKMGAKSLAELVRLCMIGELLEEMLSEVLPRTDG